MGAKTDPKSVRRGQRVHSFRVFGSMDFKLQETFRLFQCLSNETRGDSCNSFWDWLVEAEMNFSVGWV